MSTADDFYKIVDADLDSLVKMNFLTIPLMVSFTSGKPGKFGFYGEAGIKVSIPVITTYNTAGNYETKGYYPDGRTLLLQPLKSDGSIKERISTNPEM